MQDLLGQSDRFRRWHALVRWFVSVALLGQAVWAFAAHRYGFAVFSVAVVAATWLAVWRLRKYSTVVEPDGLRIRSPFRKVSLGWDDVAAVGEVSQWSPTKTVMVTTAAEKELRTDVPDTLRDEFVAYARAHGMVAD